MNDEHSPAFYLEEELRSIMWRSHGHPGIYGDDGEMQCSECAKYGCWDYRNAPLHEVRKAYQMACFERAAKSPEPPGEKVQPMTTRFPIDKLDAYEEQKDAEKVQPKISADGQKLFDRASQATKEVATWPEWKKGALVNKRAEPTGEKMPDDLKASLQRTSSKVAAWSDAKREAADATCGVYNQQAEPQQVIPGVNISWEGITGSIIDRVQLTHEDAVNEEVTQYLRKWFDPLIERLGAAERRADNAEEQLDDLCDALSGAGLIQDPESANLDIILDDLLAERDRLKEQLDILRLNHPFGPLYDSLRQAQAKVAELEGQCAVYAAQLAANLIKGR